MKTASLLMLLLLVAACAPTTPGAEPYNQATEHTDEDVLTFGSIEELRSFIGENAGGAVGFPMPGAVMRDSEMMAGDVAVLESKGAGAPDHSTTNVQVAGIDEADILKTDGEYIYTTTDSTLFIIRAYPGEEAELMGTVDLEHRPEGMLLDGDRLAVFGGFYDVEYFSKTGIRPHNGLTYLRLYDVSDPSDPRILEEYKLEGRSVQGRMIDGNVYLIVNSPVAERPLPMPLILEGRESEPEVRHVSISDVYYYPIPYASVQFTTVHILEMGTGDLDSTTITTEGTSTVYMSEENLYLASTEYVNEWELRQDAMRDVLEPRLSDEERALISKIESVDSDVLSRNEKRQKVIQIYQEKLQFSENREDIEERIDALLEERLKEYEATEFTRIHRLPVDGTDVRIGPVGIIPGSLVNQFALDEHDGILRAATTLNPIRTVSFMTGGREVDSAAADMVAADVDAAPSVMLPPQRQESTNSVFTLDSDMEIIDRLDGLAESERIFAARFMEDRLYLVTFRQTDPFFVIDLSDSGNIEVLGELKIPGFSRYLHPYDEDHIIGIGRDASETGRQRGIKISLFDVTDVSDPREVASWIAEERFSQTAAEWEHKAFLFDRERELLVIPAYSHGYDYGSGSREQYNGALVFRITDDEIRLRGLIDHGSSERSYGPSVERSLYIGDLLYTKSPYLLRINSLGDLGSVKNLTLTPERESPYKVY